MDDDSVYVAFLIGVGRNSATFAILSGYVGIADDGNEIRTARLASQQRLNQILDDMDRNARQISNWSELYSWLGRDLGVWAIFSQQAARELLPHWFQDSTKYLCQRSPNLDVEFVDANLSKISFDRLHNLAGQIDNQKGLAGKINVLSNLVLTTRPIFAEV